MEPPAMIACRGRRRINARIIGAASRVIPVCRTKKGVGAATQPAMTPLSSRAADTAEGSRTVEGPPAETAVRNAKSKHPSATADANTNGTSVMNVHDDQKKIG